jgi:hypothetical protein
MAKEIAAVLLELDPRRADESDQVDFALQTIELGLWDSWHLKASGAKTLSRVICVMVTTIMNVRFWSRQQTRELG